jgi:sigma-E factor negative regulatory protein RseA
MTDINKEMRMRISMLLDSDLDGRDNPRLIDKLEEDTDLRATWSRYSLIGDVIRSPHQQLADGDFARKISAMIADEPTVLSPGRLQRPANLRPNIVSLGLAASLAVVAILIGKSVNDNSQVLQVASLGQPTVAQVAANKVGPAVNQSDSQLNDYLVMHNETAYMAGSAGMLSYVRLVGSRSDR